MKTPKFDSIARAAASRPSSRTGMDSRTTTVCQPNGPPALVANAASMLVLTDAAIEADYDL